MIVSDMKSRTVFLIAILCILFNGCIKDKLAVKDLEMVKLSSNYIDVNPYGPATFKMTTNTDKEVNYIMFYDSNYLKITPNKGIIKNKEQSIVVNLVRNIPNTLELSITIKSDLGQLELPVFVRNGLLECPDSLIIDINSVTTNCDLSYQGNDTIDVTIEDTSNLIICQVPKFKMESYTTKNIAFSVNRSSLPNGVYYGQVIVSYGLNKIPVNYRYVQFNELKTKVSSEIIDAEYNKTKDQLYFIVNNPNYLKIFNTNTKAIQSIPLNFESNCLSVSNDGNYAAVGHQNNISYIDIQQKKIINTFTNSSTYPTFDVVFGNNGKLYYTNKNCKLFQIDLNSSIEKECKNFPYGLNIIKLHPSGKYLYSVSSNGIQPLVKINIENSEPIVMYSSQPNNYPSFRNLYFNDDGTKMYTRSMHSFSCSDTKAEDMLYMNSFSDPYFKICQALDVSNTSNKLFTSFISSDNYTGGFPITPYVTVYNLTNFLHVKKINAEPYLIKTIYQDNKLIITDPEVMFVFGSSSGDKVISISRTNFNYYSLYGRWGIEVLPVN